MAAAAPNIESVDFDALREKHPDDDIDIEQHFTPEELLELGDYEKVRLRNLKRNYLMLTELGIAAKMPDFMQPNRRPFSRQYVDSDTDDDWVPSARSKKGRKKATGSKRAWQPPVKKGSEQASVEPKKRQPKKVEKPKNKTPKVEKKKATAGEKKKALLTPTLRACFAETSDEESEGFAGFSEREIEESERVTEARIIKNEKLISQLENDSVILEEGEEDDGEVSLVIEDEEVTDNVSSAASSRQASPDVKKRYPRRNVARINYEEQRLPRDDDFIFCDDCNREHEGDCPIHGPLIIIEDTEVPNDGSDANRAVHSLPKGLVVKPSKIGGAGDGAWTEMDLAKGLRFGPYEGIDVTERESAQRSGYSWLIYEDGEVISHYVDAQYQRFSNWLRFVNCARNEQEQNLLAYQYQGKIYYKTIQDIRRGDELLVWYGDEYGEELGITEEKSELHALYKNAGMEVWECDVCGRIFPTQTWMESHRKHHGDRTGSKRYKCDQCNYSTDISCNFPKHIRTHTGEKPYRCSACSYCTTEAGNLERHMRVHSGEKPYSCTVCKYRSAYPHHLETHMRKHTGEKPYSCTVCGYRTTDAGHLKEHMRVHSGEKPYSCSICSHRSAQAGALKRHMRVHSGEKPYSCSICSHRTTEAGALKTHMMIHSGEKPYSCTECSHRAARAHDIKRHMRIHTGEKPYPCSICGQRYSDSRSLNKHVKRHRDE